MLLDKNDDFFKDLVRYHVSGQLKVAPEHCSAGVLTAMGKPDISVYKKFRARFYELTKSMDKKQYLVPYLMSSHPGSTMKDAIILAQFLKEEGIHPEQVQDFYPTPGTVSTCMFYTGLDPYTMKPIYVPKTPAEKAEQRALLQYFRPENRVIVLRALREAGRSDLIGYGEKCLVRPDSAGTRGYKQGGAKQGSAKRGNPANDGKPPRKNERNGKSPAKGYSDKNDAKKPQNRTEKDKRK